VNHCPVRRLGRKVGAEGLQCSSQLAHMSGRLEIPISFRYLETVSADSEYISLRQLRQ
jgi:hypothetical protein